MNLIDEVEIDAKRNLEFVPSINLKSLVKIRVLSLSVLNHLFIFYRNYKSF